MTHLAGSDCRVCGDPISSILDGDFCPECAYPVHNVCKTAAQDDAHCEACGAAKLQTEGEVAVAAGAMGETGHGIVLHLFSFQGRVPRSTYFLHSLLSGVVMMVLAVGIGIGAAILGQFGEFFASVGLLGVLLLSMWSEMAVTAKRFHDIDRPGSHCLLLFMPVYNVYLELLLLFKRGTRGENGYGADPLLRDESEEEDLLVAASRYEMKGEWALALESYRQTAETLDGQQDAEYARNCIQRLQEKISLAEASEAF